MRSRKISLLLLAGSIIMSALFWRAGLPFFFIFLFIPILFFFSGSEAIRRCPVCGGESTGSERFGPHDASLLENVGFHQK